MSREMSVLYDAPGPRARRLTIIFSVVFTAAVIGGLYQFLYLPLAERGQFSEIKWGPLIDPSNQYFPLIWARLGEAALNTLTAAGLAIVFAALVGVALGVLRIQLRALKKRRYQGIPRAAALGIRGITWALNGITRIFVEVFRGIPVVITIFFCWQLLGDTLTGLVVGLVLYNGIVIAEIVRSGMEGLPKGQREAADAIGLSPLQSTRLVLLPQAIRVMLPALIGQLIVILKDTALGGVLIGYQELIVTGKQLSQALPQEMLDQEAYNIIPMFVVIGAMYVVVNYALSKLAQYLERRLGRRTSGRLDKAKQAQLTGYDTGAAVIGPSVPFIGNPQSKDS